MRRGGGAASVAFREVQWRNCMRQWDRGRCLVSGIQAGSGYIGGAGTLC